MLALPASAADPLSPLAPEALVLPLLLAAPPALSVPALLSPPLAEPRAPPWAVAGLPPVPSAAPPDDCPQAASAAAKGAKKIQREWCMALVNGTSQRKIVSQIQRTRWPAAFTP
jgi:hypothetical protein